MERIKLSLRPDRFDKIVHGCPPECADLELIVKPAATESGKAGVAITFTVVREGKLLRVQAVTTLAALRAIVSAIPKDLE